MADSSKTVTAAVLTIGDEILSGRTQDKNLNYIATYLTGLGIQVREARVVPDVHDEIVAAVNAVKARYDYVFTTGGIGPTHDDITADAVAAAFGVDVDVHPEARARLVAHYEKTGGELTDARLRMARIPEGANLIDNPVSAAPGFRLGNVFVMAGIPMIMQVMMDAVAPTLEGGAKMLSRTLTAPVGEGILAGELGAIQDRFPTVSVGSYPYFRGKEFGTSVVARSTDEGALGEAVAAIAALIRSKGLEPREVDAA